MNQIAVFSNQPDMEVFLQKILSGGVSLLAVEEEKRLLPLLPLVDAVWIDARSFTPTDLQIVTRLRQQVRDLPVLVYVKPTQLELGMKSLKLGADQFLPETEFVEGIGAAIQKSLKDRSIALELSETRDSLLKESERQEQKEEALKSFFHNLLEKDFFQSKEMLKNFSRILSASRDLDQIISLFILMLKDYLGTSRIGFFLDELTTGAFSLRGAIGMPEELGLQLNMNQGLGYHLAKEGVIIRKSNAKGHAHFELDSEVRRELELLQCELAIPLFVKGKLLGILVINSKVSGQAFSDPELEFLFSLCGQIASAVENARLYSLLTYQKNYTDNIIQHITSGVITINQKEKVITFNQKAEEILGIEKELVLGKELSCLPFPIVELLRETLHEGKQVHRHKLDLQQKGRLLGASTAQLKGRQGEVLGGMMVFADLAAIQKQRDAVRQEEHMAFLNKIAMRSSHELKNCLVSIRTFTQLLPDKYADKEFRTDFYTIVNHEVDRLTSLVENLNFFAQPLDVQLSTVNIEEVLQEAVLMLPPEDWKNVTFEREILLNQDGVLLDPENMKIVFLNLFRNALQAMPQGGNLKIKVCESLHCRPEGDEVESIEIRLADSGVGMGVEESRQSFDPFYTTKSRGIGLGLTIVKKIVQAHQGEVKLSSQLGVGTTVDVVVPLLKPQEVGSQEEIKGAETHQPYVERTTQENIDR